MRANVATLLNAAGLALLLTGCAGHSEKPQFTAKPANGSRLEYDQQPDLHLNRYGETVYLDAPASTPVWRTKPGPETGPYGHELIQPEYVGYEARDVVVEQQRMGMTAANGQWPQSAYTVSLPGMEQPQPSFFERIGGLFCKPKAQPAYVGLRTYNSDYAGQMGYGNGANLGTSYGAGGTMSYTPVRTTNWGGDVPPGTVTPRIAEARKQAAGMDADGFQKENTPRYAQADYGTFTSKQAEEAYQKLLAKQKKKQKKPKKDSKTVTETLVLPLPPTPLEAASTIPYPVTANAETGSAAR